DRGQRLFGRGLRGGAPRARRRGLAAGAARGARREAADGVRGVRAGGTRQEGAQRMSGSGSMPGELLAKSPRGPLRLSLRQHLEDTEHAATRVFDLDRRWGRSFCRFFKIGGPDRKRFLLHLRIAALFHDIGKANEDFYQAVTTPGATLQ